MEIFIYSIIFIIGTLLGSFFTLAVYRIPLKQDITHKRSYCPKCNHRLEFLDLIPVFSYIFLGGKCRYCKNKIRIRYLLLEILSGIAFLLFAIGIKINIYNLEIEKLAYFLFGTFYFSTLFLIAGIEKEIHNISKSVLIFGIVTQAIYIIYLYTIGVSVYRYVIYLFIIFLLILIDTIILAKKGKENYTIQILILCTYLVIATTEEIVIISIILTLLLVAIKEMMLIKKDNKENILKESNNKIIPIGFYLCITNIGIMILQKFLR